MKLIVVRQSLLQTQEWVPRAHVDALADCRVFRMALRIEESKAVLALDPVVRHDSCLCFGRLLPLWLVRNLRLNDAYDRLLVQFGG